MSNLERISLDKSKKHPLVTIREHLIRYTWVIQNVLDKDVLDIACGTGYGMYLMSFWAKTVTGYDYDELAIKEAKRDFEMKCPAYFEVKDLEKDLDFKNNLTKRFDVVTSFETLEHLKNPIEVILNIKRHLRPNGMFYFSTPNKPDLKDNNKWHKTAFNKNRWVQILREHFGEAIHGELWGQDQYGLTKNLNKPYLVGRVQI